MGHGATASVLTGDGAAAAIEPGRARLSDFEHRAGSPNLNRAQKMQYSEGGTRHGPGLRLRVGLKGTEVTVGV